MTKTEFALVLFVGLIVFRDLFAECVNRAPGLVLSNVNFVKKVVFPLEILPWVAMGTPLFHGSDRRCVGVVFHSRQGLFLPWTFVLLPLVVLPLLLGSHGVAWSRRDRRLFTRCRPVHGHCHNLASFLITDFLSCHCFTRALSWPARSIRSPP